MTKIIIAVFGAVLAIILFIVLAFSSNIGKQDLSQLTTLHNESEFICRALPFAEIASKLVTDPSIGPYPQRHTWYVSVILAQWGIEQAWTMPGTNGYNFGNVAGLPGEITRAPSPGTGVPSTFSYAPTPLDGVRIYARVAQNGLYQAVGDAYPAGAEAQAKALGESPWDAAHYTDRDDPGSSLIAAMNTFHLQQFDTITGEPSLCLTPTP